MHTIHYHRLLRPNASTIHKISSLHTHTSHAFHVDIHFHTYHDMPYHHASVQSRHPPHMHTYHAIPSCISTIYALTTHAYHLPLHSYTHNPCLCYIILLHACIHYAYTNTYIHTYIYTYIHT